MVVDGMQVEAAVLENKERDKCPYPGTIDLKDSHTSLPSLAFFLGEEQGAALPYTGRSPTNDSSVIVTVNNNYNFSSVSRVPDNV